MLHRHSHTLLRWLDIMSNTSAYVQLQKGHLEHEDAVQITFLLLVAGNATMVNMIALVSQLATSIHVFRGS